MAGWLRLATPRAALLLGGAMSLLAILAVPLAVLSNGQSSGLPLASFGVVGYLVARRQPRNPIGWILLALAITFLLASDAGQYAVMVYRQGYHLPLARAAVFVAAWWIWLIVLLPLPIGLFPDGRLSRRWRFVVWSYGAAAACLVLVNTWRDIAGIGARQIRIDSTGELVSTGGSSIVTGPLYVVFLVFCLACVFKQVIGYRRSTGEPAASRSSGCSAAARPVSRAVVLTLVGQSWAFGAILALPIGMGIGILKYRLYEIDRLISRTISYAIVTGLLVGAFLGIVLPATRVLPFSSPVAVAASTLVAAALFNPLRRRVQRVVDRRFNRRRYDADAIVTAFALRLREAVDLDTVHNEMLAAVTGAIHPSHASLWLKPPGRNVLGTPPL